DLDRPDGITLSGKGDLEGRIWPLPEGRINGIGPKAQAKLTDMCPLTVGDLARTPREVLLTRFSERYTHWLLEVANGRDDRPVVMESTPKPVSRETTVERDLQVRRDRLILGRVLNDLRERLQDRKSVV